MEKLRAAGDLLGDLLRHINALYDNQEELAALGKRLLALEENQPGLLGQARIQLQSTDQLKAWLRQAEGDFWSGASLSGGDS